MFETDQGKVDFAAGLALLFRLAGLQAGFLLQGQVAEAQHLNRFIVDGTRRLVYKFMVDVAGMTPEQIAATWESAMQGTDLQADFNRIMPPEPKARKAGVVREACNRAAHRDPLIAAFDAGRDPDGAVTLNITGGR